MANLNIRIDDNLKQQAEGVLSHLGMNMSTAMTVYLKQIVRCGGIPFDVRDPFFSAENQTHLMQSITQLDTGKGTAHELMDDHD